MHRILVGTYRSRRDADDVRTQLLDNGFDDAQIRVEGPVGDALTRPNTSEAEPDSRTSGGGGITGLIERMFSGFLPDEADHERYERAIRSGGSLVALHGLDDAATVRARPILERNGIVDEHRVEAQAWSPPAPDVNALPNAPSGWNEAIDGSRAATGRGLQDPARPEGPHARYESARHIRGSRADRARPHALGDRESPPYSRRSRAACPS